MQNAAINSESVSAEPVKVSDPLDVCMYGERFLARYYGDVGQFEHMSIKALAAIYTGLSRVIDVFLDVANQPRVKKWEKGSYATDWNMTQADRFCEMRTALVMHVK
ncbi:MAG: hypothetical protein KDJ64_08170, partial [Nitratireductor sp.]|nr:hypothetical protein [Nitratireductor sp.]